MKSSKVLRLAAKMAEDGVSGLYSIRVWPSRRPTEIIDRILPPVSKTTGVHRFAPFDLPQEHRATILCLAAAIAESEGD